jgi:glycosyltransferase involved in cell wall biosynthesis
MMKGVSVIMAAYNAQATIGQTIDSALAQDYPEIEMVVVDDGSDDSTPGILESYGSKITIIHQSNQGVAAARNAAVAASHCEYLAFLDADDIWLPGKLTKTCAALDDNPHASLVFSSFSPVDHETGAPLRLPYEEKGPPSMNDLLTRSALILLSAVVMRRQVFDRCGGFCAEFPPRPGFEDTYLWLLAREQGEFAYVPEPLVVYRHKSSMLTVEKYERGRQIFVRLVRNRYGSPANPLIRSINHFFGGVLLARALAQIDAGDYRGALYSWSRAVRLIPLYMLRPHTLSRAFQARNVGRIGKILRACGTFGIAR